MRRIHVVGCGPRTGTTLIAEMMIACLDIDLHTEHESGIYTLPARRADIFLTKRPRGIVMAGPALRMLPYLHVIYMLRDPRDAMVSRHQRDPDRYWASLRYWKAYTPYGRKLRGHPRFTTIRYEDLVMQPDEVQDHLMQRMPFLRETARFSQYHEVAEPSKDSLDALRGVRPIGPESIGNWRGHLPRVAGQLRNHGPITDDLIEFGYETDDTWLEELEGVDPDMSESHWPEYFSRKDFRRRKRGRYTRAAISPLRYFIHNQLVLRLR